MFRRSIGFAATVLLLAAPAVAQVPLEGWLIATQRCEAYQSKNQLTNPGDITVADHVAYEMIGINKVGGDWFQVRVPGAPVTSARWVNTSCGLRVVAATPGAGPGPVTPGPFDPPAGSEATDLVLALSWQPAFCESKPSKTECQQLNSGLLPVTERQLSLHGLWPQPRGNVYCGVPAAIERLDKDGRWEDLPAPALDADTADRLAVAMPGAASFLDRHEWIKHGTCFFGDGDGDEYFDDTLRVMAAINDSAIGDLLAAHLGAELATADLRAAFDDVFGVGAGDRVQVQCGSDQGRLLIGEVKIALLGEITETNDIGALIRAAAPQSPGCPAGIVDPAGLQ